MGGALLLLFSVLGGSEGVTVDQPIGLVAGQIYVPGLQRGQKYQPGLQKGQKVQ